MSRARALAATTLTAIGLGRLRSARPATAEWLDQRSGYRGLLRFALYEAVPVRGAWAYSLGSAVLILIANQFITGIFLTMNYVPSVTEGWQSLDYLRTHDRFGELIRGLHLWGAYVLMFVIGLHMIRTFLSGSYKRPRELNWISGSVLFLLVLGMAITGAMLPWDQAAYYTAVVTTNIPSYTPVIGEYLRTLWRGGEFVGPITLLRTYGLHIWVLAGLLLATIGGHLYYLRRHGEFGSYVNYTGFYRTRSASSDSLNGEGADGEEPAEPDIEQRELEPPYPTAPIEEMWSAPRKTEDFYPHQTFRDGLVSLVCMVAVLVLALVVGAPLEDPATQNTVTYTPVPEWFYLPLDQLLVLVPQQLISLVIWLPLVGVGLLFALPFIDRGPERTPFERAAVMVVGGVIVAFIVVLTALGAGRLFNL
ncbi:MAG: cytochrome bc complex cytochrome b subunit [Candidatus Dormibacteraeota bacterium]|nr:cytochrome bc complex cytochrome b subunit [Candidatus Dormibacteraeota bacterium]